jgi:hypothetical protein
VTVSRNFWVSFQYFVWDLFNSFAFLWDSFNSFAIGRNFSSQSYLARAFFGKYFITDRKFNYLWGPDKKFKRNSSFQRNSNFKIGSTRLELVWLCDLLKLIEYQHKISMNFSFYEKIELPNVWSLICFKDWRLFCFES